MKFWTLLMLLCSLHSFAWAAEYSCQEKLDKLPKGEFKMLCSDEVNLRNAPETGAVLKCMDYRTLLRVIKQKGKWVQVETPYGQGFVFGEFVGEANREPLYEEDFALPGASLGDVVEYNKAGLPWGSPAESNAVKKLLYLDYEKAQVIVERKSNRLLSVEIRAGEFYVRGLGIGDKEGKLIGQFGLPHVVNYLPQSTVYSYLFRKAADAPEQKLSFNLNKEGLITTIKFELVNAL